MGQHYLKSQLDTDGKSPDQREIFILLIDKIHSMRCLNQQAVKQFKWHHASITWGILGRIKSMHEFNYMVRFQCACNNYSTVKINACRFIFKLKTLKQTLMFDIQSLFINSGDLPLIHFITNLQCHIVIQDSQFQLAILCKT